MLQVGIRGNFLDYVSLCFSLRIVAFAPQVLGAAWRGAAQHIVYITAWALWETHTGLVLTCP